MKTFTFFALACMQLLSCLTTSHSHPVTTSSEQAGPAVALILRPDSPGLPLQKTMTARGLDGAQARLLGGSLWLTSEALGLLMSTLRFKKNYGRDIPADRAETGSRELSERNWIDNGGKALAGLATIMAGVNLALSFSNAAMVPSPKHDKPHIQKNGTKRSYTKLAARSKLDAVTRFLGVAMVGVSLLGFPMNIKMYEAMKPQHLSLHHHD